MSHLAEITGVIPPAGIQGRMVSRQPGSSAATALVTDGQFDTFKVVVGSHDGY